MDYPGKVITKTAVTPTQTSATGVWTLDDAAAAVKNNNWPVAGVPNPISKSLRFNSADSAYLNRTPGVAGNRRTFTMNYWLKRAELGTRQVLASAGTGANAGHAIELQADNTLTIYANNTGAAITVTTTQVFRDPSAWGMLTIAFDTTQATASNRVKVYWNGTQITAFSTATYPSQNADLEFNNNVPHNIGRREISTTFYCGLYLTETIWVDGQALTPSSFGMTDPQTGAWIPIRYTGTYGTNGFYLNFKDATSTTTLGYDYSGNANNWTTNNFSVTAGSGNDSLTDVPTPWVAYNTTGDVGGVVRGNYATMNPLAMTGTYSNGNLDFTTAAADSTLISTIAVSSGKWYCEITPTAITANCQIGIVAATARNGFAPTNTNQHPSIVYVSNTGNKFINGTGTAYGATYTTNDVIGIALDLDNLTLQFYKNGTGQGSITGVTSGTYCFAVGDGDSVNTWSGVSNFGQRPFAYTPPAGFLSLCTTNLPATTIGFGLTNQGDDYFNAVLYTGNGSTQSITGVGFQPDWTWIKIRNAAGSHALADAVRGSTIQLASNLTDAEITRADTITSFASDGFNLGANTTGYSVNINSQTYVAWNWKAAGSTVTNTAGTITSTVSANTTSGFSIVTYTGNGTGGATIGHGIGIAPSMIIVKRRDGGSGYSWHVQHVSTGNTRALFLDSTSAGGTSNVYWNSTSPTSTVFTAGTDTSINANTGTFVAYCFAAVAGYSAFGSYTGNGSTDGPFVYTGFRPRYVMIKRTDSANDWLIIDTSRNPYNVTNLNLWANLSSAEGTADRTDVLSNGFKLRNSLAEHNASGGTYIYAAFAEFPFKFANAR